MAHSTDHRIGGRGYNRIWPRARVSAKEFFIVLIWIEPVHGRAEWLTLFIGVTQECRTLFTWEGCWARHFRIETCVFIESRSIMFAWDGICAIKNSICWLGGRDCSLFIHYDPYCSTWDSWGRGRAIYQMSDFINWSSHLIWMSWWKCISRLHRLRWRERFLYLMYRILRAANNRFLLFCTPTHNHRMPFVCWILVISSHNHLSSILCSRRLAERTLSI